MWATRKRVDRKWLVEFQSARIFLEEKKFSNHGKFSGDINFSSFQTKNRGLIVRLKTLEYNLNLSTVLFRIQDQ